ncbi:microfibril-associated glycoprotein 4-like [Amphibalanus amphitrite]|uniref:microfibril-associated glycoprotein 4-like n=1 Tax=Amphibalanus amphitrite TaxID=1232801 RepID=UPI001C91FF10|nr:microfibril-associated glycoprotein 4-like [Amphibalanus amphitrite]
MALVGTEPLPATMNLPWTGASVVLVLLLWTGEPAIADELEGSGDGCDCDNMAEQMAQVEASLSEQMKANDERDSRQSDQISELFKEMKKNGDSICQLSEQVTQLAAQMESSDDVQKLTEQVKKLSDDIKDANEKNDNLNLEMEKLASQLTNISERLNSSESKAEAADAPHWPPRDCSDLPEDAISGVFMLYAGGAPVSTYCDTNSTGGAWTVIQRRDDIKPRENFYRRWRHYKSGFGDPMGEFWLGLDHISTLTSHPDRPFELRVDLEDWEGARYHAIYSTFSVSDEADGYRLTVEGYSGDAGDSLSAHSGLRFSTRDRDQDDWLYGSCARTRRSGWWFRDCGPASLNGRYVTSQRKQNKYSLSWDTSRGHQIPLRTVTMKIRPAPGTEE